MYWSPDCREEVTSIDWGLLTPGSTSQMTVFVRNEEFHGPCYIILLTTDWEPAQARQYIHFSSNYDGKAIEFNEVLPVTLVLHVSDDIAGIADFRFDIVISGTDRILGDVNGDGVVDIFDALEFGQAYGSTPLD
ncbi:MAG: hypothetical protein ACFE7R_11160, partial [Candidatus Hodarchaeota archaeon]